MSGNSGENVSKTGACAYYVPPFFIHLCTHKSVYCQRTRKIRRKKLVLILLLVATCTLHSYKSESDIYDAVVRTSTTLSGAEYHNLLSLARTQRNYRSDKNSGCS